MEISLCNEVIRELPFERQCAFAAELGYRGLEIAPFTLSDAPHELSSRKLAEFRRALSDEGMSCSSLHWLLVTPKDLSITSDDPAVRETTRVVMNGLIDLAAELGGGVLVHGSPAQRQLSESNPTRSRGYAMEFFAAAADAAQAAGLVYCIEPLAREETNFVNSLAEAKTVVDEIASPALRSMIDCAATGIEGGDVPDLIDAYFATGLIAHVQVNDPNRRGPGEGKLEFAPILSALRRHGYNDWIAVEPFIYMPDGPACAARAIGYLKGLLECSS